MQVLAEDNQIEIVEFCKKEGLVLLADEVSKRFKQILTCVHDRHVLFTSFIIGIAH